MINRADEKRERPDEWGGDPSVRAMRRVFAAMESAQEGFFRELGIAPFDPRLRSWRRRALAAFDASWARAVRTGLELSEEDAGALYAGCLGKILAREGMDVPVLPENDMIGNILGEVFP